jgi:drug/metabolite transporter (DMT)-like permease
MRAAALAAAAMFFFAMMSVLIRQATLELHTFEVVFFRNSFALLIMLPWLTRHGIGALRTERLGLYLLRAGIGIVGMTASFWALTLIPLAQATALSFTAPLFATAGAALVLGELVRIRRWSAVIVGFVGTLVVIRPGLESLSPGALLSLAGALHIAVSTLIVKSLTRTERAETVVVYMVLLQSPLALLPALFVWQMPSAAGFLWLFLLAATGTLGHICFTRAYALAEVTQLQPLEFIRLPLVALFGFLFFAQVPTLWTWVGGAIIFAATAYITHREARLARAARAS